MDFNIRTLLEVHFSRCFFPLFKSLHGHFCRGFCETRKNSLILFLIFFGGYFRDLVWDLVLERMIQFKSMFLDFFEENPTIFKPVLLVIVSGYKTLPILVCFMCLSLFLGLVSFARFLAWFLLFG